MAGGPRTAGGGGARLRRTTRLGGGARQGGLGHGAERTLYIGARHAAVQGAHAQGRRQRRRVRHGQLRPMGSRGLRWAPRGPSAGPVRTWVGPSGSAQIDRIDFLFFLLLFFFFFRNYFLIWKQFQKNPRNCLKARKILRKSQKFQKNSQRHIGTWTIQIKHLELMKRILEPSNK
jgi:hypothetical protein